jgi:hypothetical protein
LDWTPACLDDPQQTLGTLLLRGLLGSWCELDCVRESVRRVRPRCDVASEEPLQALNSCADEGLVEESGGDFLDEELEQLAEEAGILAELRSNEEGEPEQAHAHAQHTAPRPSQLTPQLQHPARKAKGKQHSRSSRSP